MTPDELERIITRSEKWMRDNAEQLQREVDES